MADARPVLLVVDDEPGVIAMIDRFAHGQGFDVIARADGRQAIAELPTLNADVALVDLRMPEVSGLEVLRAIHDAYPACQVILMTAHATVDSAIEAVKLGALDYLSKPFDFDRLGDLLTTVRKGLERRRELLKADSELANRFEFYGMIGRSPVIQELFDKIRRLAPHVRTALVTGETGTGKELVARALHKAGPRAHKKFVTINCSAVVESLFECELFGHTRGAFTGAVDNKPGLFEAADGGTLFLDEIGELPLPAQAKLLRVIETGDVQRVGALDTRHVDVRVVAATNRDLRGESAAGQFRGDLFYRLSVVELHVTPLRERHEDIPYLIAAFVREFAGKFGKSVLGPTPAAERLLLTAAWPGNVRELRNVLERICILAEDRFFSEKETLAALSPSAVAQAEAGREQKKGDPHLLADAERDHISRVLKGTSGNKKAAAQLLGLSR